MSVLQKEDVLQRIISTSRSIRASTTSSNVQPTLNPSIIPLITFPPHPDILPELQSLGIADHAATKLVELFNTRCAQSQAFHREKLSQMQCLSSTVVHDSLGAYFRKAFTEHVAQLQSELLGFARLNCDKLRTLCPKQSKVAFNHDYVPVLEKYFEYNAYPSAADRALMARKSMMTVRQIEVWFQNHRNRARNQGKLLARLRPNDSLPANLSFESLDETMRDFIRPQSECDLPTSSDESDLESLAPPEGKDGITVVKPHVEPSSNPLNSPILSRAPPLAISFLVAATQKTDYHASFPPPVWPRRAPTPHFTLPPVATDLDELVHLFARLTVRDELPKRMRRKIGVLSKSKGMVSSTPTASRVCLFHESSAATRAITTVLFNGRHPAFVAGDVGTSCARMSTPPKACPIRPRVPASIAQYAVPFRTPPLPCTPNSEIGLSSGTYPSSSPRKRRKSPQLPRRVPSSSPVTSPYRSPYHPYPTLSRVSSSTSLCSSSSLDSDSSGSRTTSSSSAPSSTPTTPEHEATPLPWPTPFSSRSSKSATSNTNPLPSWTIPCNNPHSPYTKPSVSASDADPFSGSLLPPTETDCYPWVALRSIDFCACIPAH